MKKKVVIVVASALVCVLVIAFVAGQFAAKGRGAPKVTGYAVEKGEILVRVVETGTVDAAKSVEIRSRASGRLKQLLVDEGSNVAAGELVAVIDPQETQLRVRQDRAQVRGASSGVGRTALEIREQQILLQAQLKQAQIRLQNLRQEVGIQPTLTRTAIEQAKAQLESAKRARQLLATVEHPNERTTLERAVADAQASYDNARREHERQQELLRLGYVSGRVAESAKLQVDLERTRLDSARANLSRLADSQRLALMRADEEIRAAQAAYDRAVANSIQDDSKRREYQQAMLDVERARAALLQIGILQKSKDQGAAQVDQLQSVLEDSMRQLRETQVRAPFGGVISKRYIEVGDLVTALSTFSSGTAIFRLEDRSKMLVKLEMNEIDVARIREGMKATIEIDALPDLKLSGTVRKIAPASTGITSTAQGGASGTTSDAVVKYTVEIYLDKVFESIRTGMSAKCTLDIVNKQNVLRVPVAYLGKDAKGSFVLIAPDGKDVKAKPKRRDVKVGANTGAFAEILSGLKVGERIVQPEYKGPSRRDMMDMGSEG